MTRVTVRCPTCAWSVRRKVAPESCDWCSTRVEVVTVPGPRPALEQLRRVEVRCRPLASSVAAIGDARAIAAVVDAAAAKRGAP